LRPTLRSTSSKRSIRLADAALGGPSGCLASSNSGQGPRDIPDARDDLARMWPRSLRPEVESGATWRTDLDKNARYSDRPVAAGTVPNQHDRAMDARSELPAPKAPRDVRGGPHQTAGVQVRRGVGHAAVRLGSCQAGTRWLPVWLPRTRRAGGIRACPWSRLAGIHALLARTGHTFRLLAVDGGSLRG